MSNSIDERVVSMKLNNSQFEASAKQSLGTMAALSKALKFENAAKGLSDISATAKSMDLGKMASGIDSIASKFSALGIIGVTALTNIANKAVNAGIQLVKSLTVGPIGNGFSDYNEKLTSVQTIMNATGQSMQKVSGYFKQLDTYADQTIYNLSDMTGALAKFVNAGISLDKAVPAIKGIANMTALAGQGAGAASIAMYNLSQSLAGGFLTTTDYKSLNLANVATKQWKDNMIAAAVSAGTLKKVGRDAYHIAGTKAGTASTAAALFNEKLSEGWANSKILLKVLGDYGNPLTAIGRKALAAAQDVKSLPMMMETLKAGVGTGWTDTFEIVLGNLKESKALFTGLTNYVGTFLGKMQDNRNKMLAEWKKAGGRNALIDGLKNSWQALLSVLKPIKDAFRQVFPATTGKQLADMTKAFRDFTAKLKMGGETADRLKRTFAGVFSIFKIVWTIAKGIATTILNLFGIAQGGAGSFLALTAAIGDFVVKIQEWLVSSGRIQSFFSMISTARAAVLVPLLNIIGKVVEAFVSLFQGDKVGFFTHMKEAFAGIAPLVDSVTSKFTQITGKIAAAAGVAKEFLASLGIKALQPLQTMLGIISDNFLALKNAVKGIGMNVFKKGSEGATGAMSAMNVVAERAQKVWDGVQKAFMKVQDLMGPVSDSIKNLFTTITDKLAEYIKGLNFQDAVALLNTGFFILMYKAITSFMDKLGGLVDSFAGIGDAISGTFKQLTETLKTMQQNVKATIILKIAIAVALLAGSLYLLSTIDPGKMAVALGGIAGLMAGLVVSMKILVKASDDMIGMSAGPKLIAMGAAMVLLAAGVFILAQAVKSISDLSWGDMIKGLIGVGALLAGLALFTKFAEASKGSFTTAASLILLGVAIRILADAVKAMGSLDVGTIVKGLAAVTALMAGLSVMTKVMNGTTGIFQAAAGLLVLSAAMAAMSLVLRIYAAMDWSTILKGLSAVVLSVTGIGLAMRALPKSGGGVLLVASAALLVLAGALKVIGSMSLGELAKGLIGIAAGLGMLVIATLALEGAMPGALALIVVSGALLIFAGAMKILSTISWEGLAKGIVAILALVAIMVGITALLVAFPPAIVALEAFAGALLMLGQAMLLAGAGFALFAGGLAVLATVGVAGFAVLTAGVIGLLNLIPLMAQQIGLGIRAIAVVIAQSGPILLAAITTVLVAFLKALQNAAPQFFSTMTTIIIGLVNVVVNLAPRLYDAGYRLIIGFLGVLTKRVPEMAAAATKLMIAFMDAISKNIPQLVDRGAKAVIALINGIATAIRSNSKAMGEAGGNLASAIIEGMAGGLTAGVGRVIEAAKGMAKSALDAAKNLLGIHSPSREFAKLGKFSAEGFAVGLDGNKAAIDNAMKNMRDLIKQSMDASVDDIKKAQAKLTKLRKAHHKDVKAIHQAEAELAQARAEYAKANKANNLMKTYGDEQKKLDALATSYDKVSAKLVDAKQKLADAVKTRDDYAKSVQDQYDNLPDFSKETKLDEFIKQLEEQVVNTQIYAAQLQKLREMGLNDAMYKELLAKGPEGIPFAQQLLEGGQTAIDQVNTLGSALDKSAKELGDSASKALYQAAVDSAAGLVKGLEAQQANIEKQMDKIAGYMVKAIKKALGIKSPSREFMKIGKWSLLGLAKGIQENADASKKAAEQVGHGTIDALRKSLVGLSTAVNTELDVDPTIRPVLDLTQVQRDAVKMGAMLQGSDIQVGSAFASAKTAAADYTANQTAVTDQALAMAGDRLTFIQNNTSPKALSQAEIYRQTKNQISTAKGALKN